MRTSINKKSDFDFIVLDSEGNAIDMPTSNFTLDLWTWGSKCRFRASSIGGVLKGCKSDNGKLRVYVDNPGFVPGKLVGEWVSYISSEEYPDGTQRTCRYVSDFGIDMVDGDSTTNEQQVLAMMQYIQGASAYEIACEYGYQGTEEEWLNSLSLESVNAANECRELMAQLSAAEDVRNANEQTRIANEQARVESESSRSYEEDRRADAESTRLHNEQARQAAESIRKDAENYRITHENSREGHETMRQNSETARAAAEESRVAAEKSRQAAEQARETAEVSRAAAEEERKRTHDRLKTAMREYADAESLREEAEAERREAEQYRIEYEQSRQSAEADRLTNERSRVATESQRVTNETARSNAESSRVTAETARQEAEQGRVTAEEARATAEQQRADAEAARAEEFAGFAATLAAKEDAANKVTSINADADDMHYPTAKAVKDSLAKVKNIEVTPDMLSESTKQFINASGGGTITNFADDEDLTTVDNALKLADKTYDPITYSGMGRKYLRKNLVDGKNILTQEMLPSANTIYIIQYDYDLNGATITIPENCTLDFQGGSLANGTVNLNYCKIIGSGLRVKILNAKNYGYKLSSYIADVSDKELNTDVLNALIAEGIPLIIDYHDMYLSGELIVQNKPIYIESEGNNNANLYFTETENQRGIVFNNSIRLHRIHRLNIWANGYGLDMSGANGVYRSDFEDMEIKSVNSHAVYCADNSINGGSRVYDVKFERVHVQAPNGCGFWGLNGNTTKFYEVSSSNIGDSLFYNCSGTFISCNNQYYQTTGITFYKLRTKLDDSYGRYKSVFMSCNIEDYQGPIVDCEGKIYVHLTFINCVFYTHTVDGLVKESPIKIMSGLRDLTLLNCGQLGDNVDDGIGAIQISDDLSTTMPCISNRSVYTYTVSDTKGHLITLQSFDKAVKENVNTKLKKLIYNTAPNLNTGIIRATDIIVENNKTITIDNSEKKRMTLKFLNCMCDGYIKLKCSVDDGAAVTFPYWEMWNATTNRPLIAYINNANENTPLIFSYYPTRANAYILAVVTPNKGSFTLCPGETLIAVINSRSMMTYPFVRILGKLDDLFTPPLGSTDNRPSLKTYNINYQYFDTTLNKPIWWNGSAWVDATGATV